MPEPTSPVTITLRIPGKWSGPKKLMKRLPADYRLAPEALILPDSTSIDFGARAPDSQFAKIFRESCRSPATDEELATADAYSVNVILQGPGGSMPAALKMMQAAAAVVRAGGAGVFIDNSAMAHGGQTWLEMTADGGPDALSFAFVSIVSGKTDVWTMGMHALGMRDVIMKRADLEGDGIEIVLAALVQPKADIAVLVSQQPVGAGPDHATGLLVDRECSRSRFTSRIAGAASGTLARSVVESNSPVTASQDRTCQPRIETALPSREKATNPIPCGKVRALPSRATAPAGNGDPERSSRGLGDAAP